MNFNKYNPLISIIIPVYNNSTHLETCLSSVFNSNYNHFECIVVDDASLDYVESITKKYPLKFFKNAERKGSAYARNMGANKAIGDILFFVDSDVVIYPDTLNKVVDIFNNNPDVDAVIGSYDDEPFDTGFISQFKNMSHHYIHQHSNENACTFWSGCGAIRRQLFLKHGGFDINYSRPSIEDIEFGYRLWSKHHKILLQKDIQVKHLKSWTFFKLLNTEIFHRAIPWTLLMLSKKTFPNALNLKVSQRISVMLVFMMLLSTGMLTFFSHLHAIISVVPLMSLIILIAINHKFYKFFFKKKGLLFTFKVFPLHILYFFYCGLGLTLGILIYLLENFKK